MAPKFNYFKSLKSWRRRATRIFYHLKNNNNKKNQKTSSFPKLEKPALTRQTFVGKVTSLLFNMLSR